VKVFVKEHGLAAFQQADDPVVDDPSEVAVWPRAGQALALPRQPGVAAGAGQDRLEQPEGIGYSVIVHE
jgi:hypothetical protein